MQIEISDDIEKRIKGMMQLIEAVLNEEVTFDNSLKLIVNEGLNSMLNDLIGNQDCYTLISSMQQLASRYPNEIYQYMAEILKKGELITKEEKEILKKKIKKYGFIS